MASVIGPASGEVEVGADGGLQVGGADDGVVVVDGVDAGVVVVEAAGFLGDEGEGGEIPGLAVGLYPDFSGAGGDEHGVEGSAEGAMGPELGEEGEGLFGERAVEGFIELVEADDGAGGGFDGGAVHAGDGAVCGAPGAFAADGPVLGLERGEGGDADLDDAVGFESDEIAPEVIASYEVAGAVDGVYDPAAAGGALAVRAFFAEEAVVGEGLGEGGDEEALGFLVGDGDWGVVGLVFGGEAFGLVAEGEGSGFPGEFAGAGELVFKGHGDILS